MRVNSLKFYMLRNGQHTKHNASKVSQGAYCPAISFKSHSLFPCDTFFTLSGFNLFIPHIKKVSGNCPHGKREICRNFNPAHVKHVTAPLQRTSKNFAGLIVSNNSLIKANNRALSLQMDGLYMFTHPVFY